MANREESEFEKYKKLGMPMNYIYPISVFCIKVALELLGKVVSAANI
ncbi:MAG TPA: hypothetical protein VH481_10760 [Nitrososphaeraceae archaeon]